MLQAEFGESFYTMLYVVRGAQESLLGLIAREALGISLIRPDRQEKEKSVREIDETVKGTVKERQVASEG